jgi:cystathionine gamma-lyase
MRFDTQAVHAAQEPDPATGAVNVPVYLTSTYAQSAPGVTRGFEYSRTGHPTRQALERSLAALEGGVGGLAYSSGMAALTNLVLQFPKDARVLAGQDLYGGSYRLFEHVRSLGGPRTEYLDLTRPEALSEALAHGPTALVYLETPTNPLMQLADIERSVREAHAAGALVVVDNTFATPYFQRPLALGADVVLHSLTKYLGGHSDLVGGALVFRENELYERMRWLQNTVGAVPGPLDCYLVLRGIRTLGLRMRQHASNATALAEALEGHPRVERVLFPALPSHPQHALYRRQMSGPSGMVSAVLAGGEGAVRSFLPRLKVFTLAESLGGVESLVDVPALMTHQSIPEAERERRGIRSGLLRFSVGVEDPEDLLADVLQALSG